jgi:signal transduction histidine kinase
LRLRARLLLSFGLASVLPLALLGLGASRTSSQIIVDRVVVEQATRADLLAQYADTWLGTQARMLEQKVQAVRLGNLPQDELAGYLGLVYSQTPEAHVVSLSRRDGTDVVPSVFLGAAQRGLFAGRDVVDADRHAAYRAHLPLEALSADATQAQVGEPYRPAGRSQPVVGIAVPVKGEDLVLGVELELDGLALGFARDRERRKEGEVVLLDAGGAPVFGRRVSLVDPSLFEGMKGLTELYDVRYMTAAGEEVVAAQASVAATGWMVVVAERLEAAEAISGEIHRRTAFFALWAGLISLVLAVLLARQVSRPVVELKDAALLVAEGELGRRTRPHGPQEVRELSMAFNFMSTRLERNQVEIAQNRSEIEAFNRELQARVDSATAQLRAAQAQLVQSERLAAVGEVGAGVAHELNNPLAGILGLAQVMMERLQGQEGMEGAIGQLQSLEAQALRCREIVGTLLRFSRDTPLDADADPAEWEEVDISKVLSEVVALLGHVIGQRGIHLELDLPEGLMVRCDRVDLARVLTRLLTSLRGATQRGDAMTLSGFREGGRVGLRFALRSAGLLVGGDDWMASGMGLWAVRKTLADLGGQLEEPALQAGVEHATWVLSLPEA